MKWIQIKNPKWIGESAEEDVIPKSKTQSITWRRQRQLTRSGSAEEKCVWGRSAAWVWTWRWRWHWRWLGWWRWESELERLEMRDDSERERVNEIGFDKMKKKKKKNKQVVPYQSELDDGGDIERVELERNERWTRESKNENEWMTGFDKMNKK